MDDHPHSEAIELLEEATEKYPVALLLLDEDGPRLNVNTGYTGNPTDAQLNLMATYMNWLAQRTEVPPGKVAQDALQIARQMQNDESVVTMEFKQDDK